MSAIRIFFDSDLAVYIKCWYFTILGLRRVTRYTTVSDDTGIIKIQVKIIITTRNINNTLNVIAKNKK